MHDFYLENGEEFLMKAILPRHYIEQGIGKNIDIGYAVRFLQNELNSLLGSFVNGGFSHRGFALYPLVKDVSKENISRIKRLGGIADFLSSSGYDFSDSIKKYRDNISSRDFAVILSALYQDFSRIKNKRVKAVNKVKCEELDIGSYDKGDSGYLEPLSELKYYAGRSLKRYLAGFYLHGSLSTKDYVKGWSDVDTLAVVSKKTINDPEELLGLRDKLYCVRHFFYKIDPLQHHGSAVISEYDLENYCQAYFPVPIFKYAKSFFKDDAIRSLRVRDYSIEALEKLFWFVSYFRRLNIGKRHRLGSYDAKVLLHSITLFPALYLQANGILVYKKFSFGIAKKDFKKSSWQVVDHAGSIRSNWKNRRNIPFIGCFSKINPLFYYRLNSRVLDLLNGVDKRNKINAKEVVRDMFKLSEEAWGNVKENLGDLNGAKSKKL